MPIQKRFYLIKGRCLKYFSFIANFQLNLNLTI